ncbi:Helix-turn-helix domain-containing protein [Streptomyces sp. 2323.1]|uniref:helix-turn-helix domain-containing protein n=1 Tax=Streptomyces sp. 2323.1 TaxID=1938841 RepID=UPI000BBF7A8F|nr:helix-turn-helix transcriptional regulator [Streptomyces sp. 2323.1]SOE10631.1 Helix-turn-helix domain-containing protein [Streptomyces sp. 2323.1]
MPAPKELDASASLPALYGVKLRKLRLRAGLAQRQLGDKIPIAHSRIAQFELGKEVPPEDVNAELDVLLDADGDLVDLWGHIKRTPHPDWARTYMALEQQARKVEKYMAHTVPGLLQTEDYARALLNVARPSVGLQLGRMLEARMRRQDVLTRADPPVFWAILDEAVLRRPVGGTATFREQLARILCVMDEQGHVTVQVLPFAQGEHPLLGGSLTVLSMQNRPGVAYMESSHSGELVESHEAVAEYALALDHLRAQALPPSQSADLIQAVMEDLPCDSRLPTRSQRSKLAQVQLQQHAGWRLRRGR